MSWTKFKQEHLFSINAVLAEALVLYQIRKDLQFHWVLAVWLLACLCLKSAKAAHLAFFRLLGRLNSRLLLGSFYFLFFTPFSLLYRAFYMNPAFKREGGRTVPKKSFSSFDLPF